MRIERSMAMRTGLGGLCAVLFLALAFAACGSGDEAAPGGGAKAKNKNLSAAERDAKVGGTGAVPKSLDVPVFPGAVSTGYIEMAGQGTMVTFTTEQPRDEVIAYYLQELANQGWTVDQKGRAINAKKAGKTAMINVLTAKDGTEIGVLVDGG